MQITSSSGPALNLQDILAQADKANSDVRKDAKLARRIHHNGRMEQLDKNVSFMKKQADQVKKQGVLNFVFGMINNFLNIATQVLSAIFPPFAPIFMAINKAIQGILGAIQQLDPHGNKARKAGTQAEEAKKNAEQESFLTSMDDEHLKQTEESQRLTSNRLEQAIQNLQKSHDAILRV